MAKYTPQQKKEVEVEYRYRNRPSSFGYIILNTLFSTIVFIGLYFFYILQMPRDILQFFWLFVANVIAGIIGSAIARVLTAYYDSILKNSQFYYKQIIAALIYSIVLFFGLFDFIMARYVDFTAITVADFLVYMISREFLEIVAVLLAFKLLVYLLSDFMADKFAFGGGS